MEELAVVRFRAGGCTISIPILLSIVASIALTVLLNLFLNC